MIVFVCIATFCYFFWCIISENVGYNDNLQHYFKKSGIRSFIISNNAKITTVGCEKGCVFRIASVTKSITAVMILSLVDKKLVGLDEYVVDIFGMNNQKIKDPRVRKIRVRDLLQHSGGWDSSKNYDFSVNELNLSNPYGLTSIPAFDPQYELCKLYNSNKHQFVIDFLSLKSLDFDPGEKYCYSNFGYCVLGRIIELITKKSYIDSVNEIIGFKTLKYEIGSLIPKQNEIKYDDGDAEWNFGIGDGLLRVPPSYGSFDLDFMDSHGGLVTNIDELDRFVRNTINLKYFSRDILDEILKKPSYLTNDSTEFYSLGFRVTGLRGDTMICHNGALTWGTFAFVGGVLGSKKTVCVLANHLPKNIAEFLKESAKKIELLIEKNDINL